MDAIVSQKTGATKIRWVNAAKCKAFDSIRNLVVANTKADEFLVVLASDRVSVNVYLRRLHNFALDMNWLLAPVIAKRAWPKVEYGEKRAITHDEHLKIIEREKNSERRAYYEVCWHVGASQSDIANLNAENIDWQNRTISFDRKKTGRNSKLTFGSELERVLRSLPAAGKLFPYLASVREADRATEFRQRCGGLGISGVTLQRYLCKGRPRTERRELFLRSRAPIKPLHPASVSVARRWIDKNGLQIRSVGIHALRHAFAVHLLRQGVSTKAIGDTMGHSDVRSTAVYLRLAVEDLRTVGLPVPETISTSVRLKSLTHYCIPCNSCAEKPQTLSVRFCSGFKTSLERYLAIKHAVGVNFENERAVLLKWDGWLHQSQDKSMTVTRESFQRWVETLNSLTPTNRRNRMRAVRNFLLFHARDNPVEFIPDVATFPKATPTKPPRLVSVSEMTHVLAVARQLTPGIDNPVRAQTIRIALVLAFCCGLRRGELLRLRVSHLDTKQQLLRIEKTKFHKSRLVPLPESVAKELQDYMEQRRRFRLPLESNSFLIGSGLHSDSQCAYIRSISIWLNRCAAFHSNAHKTERFSTSIRAKSKASCKRSTV